MNSWEDIAQGSSVQINNPLRYLVSHTSPLHAYSLYSAKDMLKHWSPTLVKITWAFPRHSGGQSAATPTRVVVQEGTSHHLQEPTEPNKTPLLAFLLNRTRANPRNVAFQCRRSGRWVGGTQDRWSHSVHDRCLPALVTSYKGRTGLIKGDPALSSRSGIVTHPAPLTTLSFHNLWKHF